jgi:hypothetical protein
VSAHPHGSRYPSTLLLYASTILLFPSVPDVTEITMREKSAITAIEKKAV